jgi:hypothetical protein
MTTDTLRIFPLRASNAGAICQCLGRTAQAHSGAPRGVQRGAGASGQVPAETRPTGPVSAGRETTRVRVVSRNPIGMERRDRS